VPPFSIVLSSAATFASNPEGSGLLVMMRSVPACELAPYSVPCGPASASTRAMSNMCTSSAPVMVVIGCSSRYTPTLGREPEWLPSPPLATPRMYTCRNPGPENTPPPAVP